MKCSLFILLEPFAWLFQVHDKSLCGKSGNTCRIVWVPPAHKVAVSLSAKYLCWSATYVISFIIGLVSRDPPTNSDWHRLMSLPRIVFTSHSKHTEPTEVGCICMIKFSNKLLKHEWKYKQITILIYYIYHVLHKRPPKKQLIWF